jgi:hypothetical protein
MAYDVIVKEEMLYGEHITTKVGYQGDDQSPLLLVYREYRQRPGAAVYFADVVYRLD